ncbi:unnamed protein product [Linum trigynum]|uniref:Alpha 1,4-glycosyltransferase domain-containing protein n=1 Tax=Linum trigynum TaxID=586398 RepID=A0AAV2H007_9ROSI
MGKPIIENRVLYYPVKPLAFFSVIFILTVYLVRTSMITTTAVPLPSSPSSEPHHRRRRIIKSSSSSDEDPGQYPETYLVPPTNLTTQERIHWFRSNLPAFQILKSDNLTSRFHKRARRFLLRNRCELRFFMTWISPASSFGNREFLAMESLFKSNPDACLVLVSRSLDSRSGRRILKPLLDRGFRAAAFAPDLSNLLRGTPAEQWFEDLKTGEKDPGEIPLPQNLSNLVRLAVLYKYGGVYLDTDFIVLKSFARLRNSIGAQSADSAEKWTRLNNAVLVFDKSHPLLLDFMAEFAATFDGSRWGHNGPYLVSRVVDRVGNGSTGRRNFTIMPPMAFYPAYWSKIGGYFRKPATKSDSRWVSAKLIQLSGKTFAVHLWNKESRNFRIEEGSILWSLISRHCIICQGIYR